MKRIFLHLKKNWTAISTVAALALSVFNFVNDTIYAHNLKAIVRMGFSIRERATPGMAPYIYSFPEQTLLVNSGKSSEVILNSELVVGLPQNGKSDLFCTATIEHKDPIIIESKKVAPQQYKDNLKNADGLIQDLYFDDMGRHIDGPPEVRYGVSLTYLNGQNEIATIVIDVGKLLVDQQTGEIVGTSGLNGERSVTVIGLEPFPLVSRIDRLLNLGIVVDDAKILPCSAKSLQGL
ncbi:hypothetical protein [Paraburkholderia guartelaensis]|uniref:hypothetical protein n=1 Tax=Paraburkholderia guartelaensis TaxID=2546446 RepID=UPI002AB7B780|nr:hypothetical protein [Paraburkholderia guartelaensis]